MLNVWFDLTCIRRYLLCFFKNYLTGSLKNRNKNSYKNQKKTVKTYRHNDEYSFGDDKTVLANDKQ